MTTFAASLSALAGLRAAQETLGAKPALWGHGGAYDPHGELALYERSRLFNHAPRARLGLPGALECLSRGTRLLATPGQVDGHANANLSVIGDWANPKIALGGTRGLPDASEIHFVIPTHSPRHLVEQVDFVSTAAAGRAVAPWLFTDLGVFCWLRADKVWELRERRAGTTVDEIRGRSGFPIAVTADPSESPEPDENWLRALDQVDPRRARDLDFSGGPAARLALLAKIEAAELAAADLL
jgi:hypothetical protein